MKATFGQFFKEKVHNFTTATTNLFIFLPYFFSVAVLIKTLFAPWKNLQDPSRNKKGLDGWISSLTFGMTSRFVGGMVRASVLVAFLFIQLFFVLLLPGAFLLYIALIPIRYVFRKGNMVEKFEEEKDLFIKNHLLNPANQNHVLVWADSYFQKNKRFPWWELRRLMSMPPMARDWTSGFTPTLDEYAEDITGGKITPVVGRQKETEELEHILSKSADANVIIVGEEDVGRKTIVKNFALQLYNGKTNPVLMYKRVLKLDLEKLLAKTADFVSRQELLKLILKEAADAKNIILYIENFERYVTSQDSMIDLSAVFEEYARSPKVQFIALTTPSAFQKYIFKNSKISSSFEKLDIAEITEQDTFQIILNAVDTFEKRYSVLIPIETVWEAVSKSEQYITSVPFPQKALNVLDGACVLANSQKNTTVLPQHIDSTVSQKTHVPLEIDDDLKNKLVNLESELSEKIIAQKKAVDAVAATIRKSYVLSKTRKKPLSTFLFLGPTGVGKTETAKAVAEILFGSPDKMIRVDMSQFQTNNTIGQLVGDTFGNPGILTSAIRQNPYGVLLLDEIEKANMDVLNIFLTMLDEAYFSDGEGKRVDCRNLIIVATSNAGADLASPTGSIIDLVLQKGIFTPEFINRFDGVISFDTLSDNEIKEVAQKMIVKIHEDIKRIHNIDLQVTSQFLDSIIQKGYNPRFGARNMAHIIQDEIENKLAQVILEKKVAPGQIITF